MLINLRSVYNLKRAYEVGRHVRQTLQLYGLAAERNYLYSNKNSAADSSGFLKDMLEARSVFSLPAEIFQ